MRSPETRYAARPVAAVLLVVLAVVLAFSAVMNVPGASADPIGGDPRCTQTIKSGALEWDLSKYLAAFATGDRPTTWRNGSGEVGDDGSVDASFEGTSVHFDEESGAWLKITDPVVTLDGSGAGALRAEVAYGIAGQDEDGIVEFDPEQEPLRTATVEVITVKGQVVVKDRTMTADELTAQWSDAFLDLLKGSRTAPPRHRLFHTSTRSMTLRTAGRARSRSLRFSRPCRKNARRPHHRPTRRRRNRPMSQSPRRSRSMTQSSAGG
ncbi:hypothetical protein [Nocardioides alcanivorans]|uniref:hypothetical protein n=1 Tax=Nocardioides alcanivorans TaxID=2897352 RepID=UPI001F48BDED|nr:hypothetical protein [Nocardioides alcanivorans]